MAWLDGCHSNNLIGSHHHWVAGDVDLGLLLAGVDRRISERYDCRMSPAAMRHIPISPGRFPLFSAALCESRYFLICRSRVLKSTFFAMKSARSFVNFVVFLRSVAAIQFTNADFSGITAGESFNLTWMDSVGDVNLTLIGSGPTSDSIACQ
jgi:hypothetical protein